MNNLISYCEDNSGGLYTFWFIPKPWVTLIPYPPTGKLISKPIVIASGKTLFTAKITPEANNLSIVNSITENGPLYDVTVTGFVAGDAHFLAEQVEEMADYKEFILIAQDNDERQRILGTLEKGLDFSFSFTTGPNYGNRKGYTVSFVGQFSFNPYLYLSPILDIPEDLFPAGISTVALDAYIASKLAVVNEDIAELQDKVNDLELNKLDRSGDTATGVLSYNNDKTLDSLDLVHKQHLEDRLQDVIDYVDSLIEIEVPNPNRAYSESGIPLVSETGKKLIKE